MNPIIYIGWAGYPVTGNYDRYVMYGHFAGLSGRIFDYFEQKFMIYPFRQLKKVSEKLSYF